MSFEGGLADKKERKLKMQKKKKKNASPFSSEDAGHWFSGKKKMHILEFDKKKGYMALRCRHRKER